jgi:hypothetical protein
MNEQSIPQSFLDSSVLRSLLLGTQIYNQYLESQLTNQKLYISNYVQMEMKRSYLINLISFYFVLRLSTTSYQSTRLGEFRNIGLSILVKNKLQC